MNKGIVSALIVIGAFFSMPAKASDPNIIICNTCSSGASFASTASDSFDEVPPDVIEGTKEIFVVNLTTGAMPFYEVTRSYDSPGNEPGIGDYFVTEARLASPNATDEQNVGESIIVLDVFFSELASTIPANELGLSFGSAVDLVGPNDSAAGFNRNQLNNALSDHFRNFSASLLGNVNDTISRIVRTFVAESSIDGVPSVTVEFADGSIVTVIVTNLGTDLNNDDLIVVTLSVDPNSVRLPSLPAVPQTGGQLGGFGMTTNNDDLGGALRDLFDRLGANTSDSSGSGGGCRRFSCSVEGSEISCVIEMVSVANCDP